MTKARPRPPLTPEWADDAACKGMHALFFSNEYHDRDKARAVCRRCPVIAACLEDALALESWAEREHAGIRAALSPAQLIALRRRRYRKSRPHHQENRAMSEPTS